MHTKLRDSKLILKKGRFSLSRHSAYCLKSFDLRDYLPILDYAFVGIGGLYAHFPDLLLHFAPEAALKK